MNSSANNDSHSVQPRAKGTLRVAILILGAAIWVWLLSRGWKVGAGNNTDFAFFYHAALAARTGDDMYTVHDGGYVYPPLLAVLLVPLSHLELPIAAHVWTILLWALLPLSAWLLAREAAGRFRLPFQAADLWAVASASVIVLGENWKSEFQYGNCDLLLILPCALALRFLGVRPALCGLMLAFAVSIKYFPLVFVPYLLIRRRWRESAWLVAGLVLFALLPALYLGWTRNLQCLGTALRGVPEMLGLIPRAGGAGITPVDAGYSLSIMSCLTRWAKWQGWSGGAQLGLYGAIASACLTLGAAIYRANGYPLIAGRDAKADDASSHGRAVTALEWVVLFGAGLLFAPQTTHRHLNMLLPAVVLACALVWSGAPRRWFLVGAIALFVLGAAAIPGVPSWRRATELWNQNGGAAACILSMLFVLTWVGLRGLERLRDDSRGDSTGTRTSRSELSKDV
jgi:hypothetical protein